MIESFRSALYVGRVTHRRLRPVQHALSYRVYALLLDLDELPALDEALTWFSRSRFNLVSVHDRDHGAGGPQDLAAHVREAAAGFGVDASGPAELLCYPRVLGYVFNPLAVYFLHDADGAPSGVLYEVSNTFGERHSYLIPAPKGGHEGTDPVIRQTADKKFHVSPFMPMEMRYHFRVRRPRAEAHLLIRETERAEGPDRRDGAVVLHAGFQGRRVELSDRTLLSAFAQHPLMTLKVIGGIHAEAVRLLAKGLRLRAGDPTPAAPITFVPAQGPATA